MIRGTLKSMVAMLAASAAMATAAQAGGFDRSGVNVDMLFSDKRIDTELSATYVSPQRTINNVTRGSNEAVQAAIAQQLAPVVGVYGRGSRDIRDEVRGQIADDDWQRVHFLGNIPYPQFLGLIQLSTVHIYLTYPFVLSWSLLEAMSAGCAIVASDTAPVREVIQDGITGKLVEFFDPVSLAGEVCALLDLPERRAQLGARARQFIQEHYDLRSVCLPRQAAWVGEVAARSRKLANRQAQNKSASTVQVDGVNYDAGLLSEAARSHLASVKVCDDKIQQIQRDMDITWTARNAFAHALRKSLPE